MAATDRDHSGAASCWCCQLALRRRQDHDHARARRSRAEIDDLDLGDDPAARAPARSTAGTITSSTAARFDAMVDAGELLEHATVFGNCYGTPRAPVEAALAAGRDIVADVDWQGTQQLKRDSARATWSRSSSCRRASARSRSGCAARAQDSDEVVAEPHGEVGRRDEPLAGIRLRHRQRELERERAPGALDPRRRAARRERQIGLAEFVNRLRAGA